MSINVFEKHFCKFFLELWRF